MMPSRLEDLLAERLAPVIRALAAGAAAGAAGPPWPAPLRWWR